VNIVSGFADVSLLQLLLVAGVALFASIVGGWPATAPAR
jgi:hypothetical protein